jgi:cell division protein FtsA
MGSARSKKVVSLASRRRARDQRIIAGVDIGASKVACFIAQCSSENGDHLDAEVIGVGCHGARVRAAAGLSVEDMEIGLRSAVDAAERMAGVRIDKVHVAAPGRLVRSRRIGVDLEIADGVVTHEDVDDSLREGAKLAAAPDCAALQASPIAYGVDADSAYDNPVGRTGSILSTELLGLSMRQSAFDNLAALVERCGLAVEDIAPAPLAAAESVLIEDEKELGVVLIDIGASSTDFAVYDDGALVRCGGVPVGGAHITRDIAQIFGAPLSDAERIKTLHGAALIGPGDEHRSIDFPQLGDGAETNRASRADLCEVIIPRMEEIFELTADRLGRDERGRMALRRVVITGGGSLLLGAREIAEKSLSMKARVGRPLSLVGAPEASAAPGFSVCAGLIQTASGKTSSAKFSLGVRRQSLHSLTQSAFLGGARAWLRAKF